MNACTWCAGCAHSHFMHQHPKNPDDTRCEASGCTCRNYEEGAW